jgi:predicted RNA-binding protein with PIN domain
MQGDNGAVVEEGQAIAAAQQLVNEAQTLNVKVDREVEKLREVRCTARLWLSGRPSLPAVPSHTK